MSSQKRIVITGATGALGRLVLKELEALAPTSLVVAMARHPESTKAILSQRVEWCAAVYENYDSLTKVFSHGDKVLFISSNAMGQRDQQHRNVVDAAKAAGVSLLIYTSILHADRNPMALAAEHRDTEAYIKAAGVPYVLLRNGWYTENYTASLATVLQYGVVMGAARDGRISSCARADLAAAAAVVLTDDIGTHIGKTYELAGDDAYTLSEYATEIARQSGKPIVYQDLPEADFKAALQQAGVPEAFASIFADCDARAAEGILYEPNGALSRLIGRPTTSLADSIRDALTTEI